jgi:maleate isomerase
MPSLPAIPIVERRTGLPTLSAATATAHQLLAALGLEPLIDDAGRWWGRIAAPGGTAPAAAR